MKRQIFNFGNEFFVSSVKYDPALKNAGRLTVEQFVILHLQREGQKVWVNFKLNKTASYCEVGFDDPNFVINLLEV